MKNTLRDNLNRRTRKTLIEAGKQIGRLTDAEKKPPSQKRSEALKKKDRRRAGLNIKTPVIGGTDCHTCQEQPCEMTPDTCSKRVMVHPCLKCGTRVRHYIDPNIPWEYCPRCKAITGVQK